jgi:hypothetical protein
MYVLILPLGIINGLLVIFQVLTGLQLVKVSYKIHKISGLVLCLTTLLHGAIAIFA